MWEHFVDCGVGVSEGKQRYCEDGEEEERETDETQTGFQVQSHRLGNFVQRENVSHTSVSLSERVSILRLSSGG